MLQTYERTRRGYDLSVEQRVLFNTILLKRSFLKQSKRSTDYTMGRYYHVPGALFQGHEVFSIDTLTGRIFLPDEVKRRANFFTASYEQQEKDAASLDYIYARPNPFKNKKTFTLPPGYKVLPLSMNFSQGELTEEAKEIIRKTELELFTPVLSELANIQKRGMSPNLWERILKLARVIS